MGLLHVEWGARKKRQMDHVREGELVCLCDWERCDGWMDGWVKLRHYGVMVLLEFVTAQMALFEIG